MVLPSVNTEAAMVRRALPWGSLGCIRHMGSLHHSQREGRENRCMTMHTQCKPVSLHNHPQAPLPRTSLSNISLPGHLGRDSSGEKMTQRHGLGCSRTLMSRKRETESVWVEVPVPRAPGAYKSLHPMAVVEILPGVHLPAPQRVQGQQVFPRLALWCSEPRGAQENKETGGKGESGRGERQARAVLSQS